MVTGTGVERPGRDRALLATWLGAVAVGALIIGLSLWRLMPGLGFWDTAEFQMVLPLMGTAHPTGYPTYVLIGWLASVLLQPLGEPSLRMNVLSAILVGVGAALTVDLVRRLSASLAFGIVAALGVALTPIVWAVGTHADPHALHFTLIVAILWLLVRWEESVRGSAVDPDVGPRPVRSDRLLLAAAVVVGLSVGNHSLTLLFGPGIVLFVLAVEPGILRRGRFVLANIAAFAIPTVLVRFEMILRAGWFRAPFVYADPSTWSGFWYVTLGAQFHGWLTDPLSDAGGRIADLVAIGSSQFGPLSPLILVAVLIAAIRQPRYVALSGTTFVLTCFFNSVYPDGAIDRYYIGPILIAWTWLAIGAATVVDAVTGRDLAWEDTADGAAEAGLGVRAALRPIGLAVAGLLLIAPTILALPGRAAIVDRSDDRAAQAWTDDVLAALEPNAVVVSWWSYSTPLWYVTIVDGRRPDILIIDDRNRLDQNLGELDQVIERFIATRPVYLVRNGSSELGALEGRYNVTPVGAPHAPNLLHVTPIVAAGR